MSGPLPIFFVSFSVELYEFRTYFGINPLSDVWLATRIFLTGREMGHSVFLELVGSGVQNEPPDKK